MSYGLVGTLGSHTEYTAGLSAWGMEEGNMYSLASLLHCTNITWELTLCADLFIRQSDWLDSSRSRTQQWRGTQGKSKGHVLHLRQGVVRLHLCGAGPCSVVRLHLCGAGPCSVVGLHLCGAGPCSVIRLHLCGAGPCNEPEWHTDFQGTQSIW